jgi:hypothetical protein
MQTVKTTVCKVIHYKLNLYYSHSFRGSSYTLNIILNSNFEPTFQPIISFIKNFVAEKVAKLLAE